MTPRVTFEETISDREMMIMSATQAIVTSTFPHGQEKDVIVLLEKVHAKVSTLLNGAAPAAVEPVVESLTPAQIRRSITPDALISFIDGKGYKTLKRHLTKHGLDIAGYRARYGLPADYPTTAASYSAKRSALAKSLGLGQPGRAAPPSKSAKTKAALAA